MLHNNAQNANHVADYSMLSFSVVAIPALAICFLLLLTGGCSAPRQNIRRADILGTYRADYTLRYMNKTTKLGSETLKMRNDGTYTQYLTVSNGSLYKNSGKWEYIDDEPGPRIRFENMIDSFDDETERFILPPKTVGIDIMFLSRDRHNVIITINEDMEFYYKKSD